MQPPRPDPPATSAVLDACARGELPANVAVMRIIMQAASRAEARRALASALVRADRAGQRRLRRAGDLLRAHPDAFALIKGIMAKADHVSTPPSASETIESWAAVFDRLALDSPVGAVALYALGSPALLAQATDEVVARLRAWGLVAPDGCLLEIGCGNGRFLRTLAPYVGHAIGVDISAEMVRQARAACAGAGNVRLHRCSGRDLAGIADESLTAVLAADVFPYLVQAGDELARRHVEEAFRVLQPGGRFAVFNYSYRGDVAADVAEMSELLTAAGFEIERGGTHDLALWDAPTFLARKRPWGATACVATE